MARPVTGDEIREAFLRFYEEQDHLRMPSASLIPAADPTLLLTSAGMTQFKAYFSGEAEPPHPRIVTSQKCFRTTDIEEVGDTTHHTFFEMLGNFSFAEYFKDEACEWALKLWTDVLEFDLDRLYVTVHDTDDEAQKIWEDLGISSERIFRFGDSENWWGPAGDEGPCGPSSELHYMFGDHADKPKPGNPEYGVTWGPNISDDMVELYNLVFTQFYHQLDGSRTELPGKNIDTGMGLERTVAAAQNTTSVYDTDIMQPFIAKAEQLAGKEYGTTTEIDRALRVVAEHGRSATFLISDGVVPGNTGRGYVLRRVMRRAMRFGLALRLESPFMSEMADVSVENMGHVYPDLKDNLPFIKSVLETEEQQFAQAVASGVDVLQGMLDFRSSVGELTIEEALKVDTRNRVGNDLIRAGASAARNELASGSGKIPKIWTDALSGPEAFLLYSTYGMPIEVTDEICQEEGLAIDRDGFNAEMEAERTRSRASISFGGDTANRRVYADLDIDETPFLGYVPDTATRADSIIAGIIKDGAISARADAGDGIELVLRETPFFAERGGQMGDTGVIKAENGIIRISDTQNPYAQVNVHFGTVEEGYIEVGDGVVAEVDAERRERLRRNHTGTHLIHAALRQVLGTHVRQAGSLVAPDRLRFDFTHIAAMSREEILEVQRVVNDRIRANQDVQVEWTTYQAAVANGALAFFGDKYDETAVRTIKIDAPWSYELCGGTHCSRTGDIGPFFIITEQSIGSGMRRIEAFTGRGAEDLVTERLHTLDTISDDMQAPVADLHDRVKAQASDLDKARRQIEELQKQLLLGSGAPKAAGEQAAVTTLIKALDRNESVSNVTQEVPIDKGKRVADIALSIGDVPVVVEVKSGADQKLLRSVGDAYRDALGEGIVVVASVTPDHPALLVWVTDSFVARGLKAGEIVREAAKAIGGGGGGRPQFAQAGGKNAGGMADAVVKIVEIVSATAEA